MNPSCNHLVGQYDEVRQIGNYPLRWPSPTTRRFSVATQRTSQRMLVINRAWMHAGRTTHTVGIVRQLERPEFRGLSPTLSALLAAHYEQPGLADPLPARSVGRVFGNLRSIGAIYPYYDNDGIY